MMHGAWHLYRAGEKWQRPARYARDRVYGRLGRPCLVCGSDIMSRRTSRITHYCPSCQK